jgi:YgiT-type zinc finger domain-containing protein
MTDNIEKSYQCNECQAGMMHLQHLTYFTWLDEELVTVPNFPAWVCDMCSILRRVKLPCKNDGRVLP